jgi:hypothetical protein
VLSFTDGAPPSEPGGLLYVPPQSAGRVDNPADYATLYVGDSPAGVCAEVFNRGKYRTEWVPEMFRGLPVWPASRRVLAWYDLDDAVPICNLDDPAHLTARGMRPSDVITRDYTRSQTWALAIFKEHRWAGVSWWSFHDSRWASIGLWDRRAVTNFGFEELTIDSPAIVEAAAVLSIRIRARQGRRSRP